MLSARRVFAAALACGLLFTALPSFSSSSPSTFVSANMMMGPANDMEGAEYFYTDAADYEEAGADEAEMEYVDASESDFDISGLGEAGFGYGAGLAGGYGGAGFAGGYGGGVGVLAGAGKKDIQLPAYTAKAPIYQELPTKTLAPMYAAPVVNYHTTKQPILKNRVIVQPVIQQRLVEQPILQRRLLIQPVVRQIVNQPIVQPKIIQQTTLEKTLESVPVVQPRIIHQDVVQQQLLTQVETNKPVVNAPTVKATAPIKAPTTIVAGGKGL